jgi:outer membrane protein TolC
LRVNAQELVFRNSAVKVSEQNVASTEKAYEAGIVKASDVVNAILASFDVRRQKLLLLISMSEQQLLNALNRGVSSRAALEAVSYFFSE